MARTPEKADSMSGFEWRKVSSNESETNQELCKKLTKCQVFIEEGKFERK